VLIEWTVRFVKEIVAPWIIRKGGWVSDFITAEHSIVHFYLDFFLQTCSSFFFAMQCLSRD
jgi:hypothetical protein